MAGKSPVLPTDLWIRLSVMEKKLQELVRDGLLHPRTSRDLLEWRVPPTNHREPTPPEGYVVSFIAFHERGLGVLPVDSCGASRIITGWSSIISPPIPSHRPPFLWPSMRGTWGVEPHWKLWLHLFKSEHFAKKVGKKGVRRVVHAGSCTIQVWAG
jgi:hypothetical protein